MTMSATLPYEGRKLTGWPVTVLSRGRVAVEDGELKVERGSGEFLPGYLSDAARPLGRLVKEMDVNRNFGAEIETYESVRYNRLLRLSDWAHSLHLDCQ